jgi:hypothetical protein
MVPAASFASHFVVKAGCARSPWQNPYIERLIGSIHRECLDHVINERHLRRVLSNYFQIIMRREHISRLAHFCGIKSDISRGPKCQSRLNARSKIHYSITSTSSARPPAFVYPLVSVSNRGVAAVDQEIGAGHEG